MGVRHSVATDQRWEHYDALDGRAAWFYEAVTNDIAMHGQGKPAGGEVYIATYQDHDGDWLDGGISYVLPAPNVPARSILVNDPVRRGHRCIIKNEQQIADRSSRMDLLVNEDGSVDLYWAGRPAGKEQTGSHRQQAKRGSRTSDCTHAQAGILDKSWVLPDIESISRRDDK